MTWNDLSNDERDRLRTCFAAGFASGSGCAWSLSDDPALIDLITRVSDDWLTSLETIEGPLCGDNLPGWLLEQQRQTYETAPLRGLQ
jgi:hypothetical protein